jgi:hypothetical protein
LPAGHTYSVPLDGLTDFVGHVNLTTLSLPFTLSPSRPWCPRMASNPRRERPSQGDGDDGRPAAGNRRQHQRLRRRGGGTVCSSPRARPR